MGKIKRIPLAKPFIGQEEIRSAKEVLSSGWLTQGPKTVEFEKAFSKYVGSKYACAVSNCTNALFLSLLAVGVKPGDRVLTVSHSFIATANAVRHAGAEPIFIDVENKSFGMDVVLLEKFLRKNNPRQLKISAIMPVHQMGFVCDIEKILIIAKKYHLPVVEDAACAIGSELHGQKIGKPHSDAACFSFHPRKVLTTGDGGMITTNSKKIDSFVRLRRIHGMNIPSEIRHKHRRPVIEKYLVTGYNFRLTDIQSAIGLAQLKKMPAMIAERQKLAAYYKKKLKQIPWIHCAEPEADTRSNWQSFPIQILPSAPLKPLKLLQYLFIHGIQAKPGIMNAHEEAPYRKIHASLPVSEYLKRNTILLPFYNDLSTKNIDFVVRTLVRAR